MTVAHLVKIEFQRVQTFLFAVPRLADIVGANALLGYDNDSFIFGP